MSGRVIRIERISSRSGVVEEPVVTTKGYQLADPAHGKHKHHAEHATYVTTLDEAAAMIEDQRLPADAIPAPDAPLPKGQQAAPVKQAPAAAPPR